MAEEVLYAVFLKETFTIAHWLDSLYSECGFYIGNEDVSNGTIYFMYKCFGSYAFQKKAPGGHFYFEDGFEFSQCRLEFLRIKASAEEIKHLKDIGIACCNEKRKYNKSDKVLSIFSSVFSPLVDNVDIYNAPTLHNAQALLLILKAGLDSENNKDLLAKLKELNSREVCSTQLYRTILMTGVAVMTFR